MVDLVRKFLFLLIVFCCNKSPILGKFCSENLFKFHKVSSGLHFTKELKFAEYGIVNSFKSLHCCARGYTTVEWYKDGEVYPWPGGTSSFILDTESGNQTIYAAALKKLDSGRYTCRVSNQTISYQHATTLTVFDSDRGYADVPLPTYTPPGSLQVPTGGHARMYCEAFVGKIDLPDARNEIQWQRSDSNTSLVVDQGRVTTVRVNRENNLTVGLYLIIDEVKKHDYGEYICVISNAGDQNIEMVTNLIEMELMNTLSSMMEHVWLSTMKIMSAIVFLCLLIYFICNRYGFAVCLYFKRYSTFEKCNDCGKEYDVFVLYETKNEDFAIDTLIPKLEECDYVVRSQSFNNITLLPPADCQTRLTASKCVLVVASASQTEYFSEKFQNSLRTISDFRVKLICLLLHNDNLERSVAQWTRSIPILDWPLESRDVSKLISRLRFYIPTTKATKPRRNTNKLYVSVSDGSQCSV